MILQERGEKETEKKTAVQLSSLLFFLLLYFLFSDTQTKKKWKNKKYVQRIEGQE